MPGWWRRLFGNQGERTAARYLRRHGFRILSRQWWTRWGEFDLIALDDQTIVFIEVKTRRTKSLGHPAEAVTREKQRRMTRQALVFLKRKGWLERRARFDVVSIVWPVGTRSPEIQHFRSAFEPTGEGQFFA